MKTEIDTTEAAVLKMLNLNTSTAPSLRVPVTTRNREFLRRLRAAELCAWENADRKPGRRTSSPSFLHRNCIA